MLWYLLVSWASTFVPFGRAGIPYGADSDYPIHRKMGRFESKLPLYSYFLLFKLFKRLASLETLVPASLVSTCYLYGTPPLAVDKAVNNFDSNWTARLALIYDLGDLIKVVCIGEYLKMCRNY